MSAQPPAHFAEFSKVTKLGPKAPGSIQILPTGQSQKSQSGRPDTAADRAAAVSGRSFRP